MRDIYRTVDSRIVDSGVIESLQIHGILQNDPNTWAQVSVTGLSLFQGQVWDFIENFGGNTALIMVS